MFLTTIFMPLASLEHGLKCLLIEFGDLAKWAAFLFGFLFGFGVFFGTKIHLVKLRLCSSYQSERQQYYSYCQQTKFLAFTFCICCRKCFCWVDFSFLAEVYFTGADTKFHVVFTCVLYQQIFVNGQKNIFYYWGNHQVSMMATWALNNCHWPSK